MPDFPKKKREQLAEQGQAMPNGAFPIRNRADLKRAIQAFGRAKNPEEVKAWIKKRAKDLNCMDLLPESWMMMQQSDKPALDELTVLEHVGVKGMRWGVRRDKTTGVRPIAAKLNDSRFGKMANANAQRYMDKQRRTGRTIVAPPLTSTQRKVVATTLGVGAIAAAAVLASRGREKYIYTPVTEGLVSVTIPNKASRVDKLLGRDVGTKKLGAEAVNALSQHVWNTGVANVTHTVRTKV